MALLIGGNEAGELNLRPEELRTHGVVVGMTGSGKTGLCLVMLEELTRAGIPIIAIDPKGDLGNLALVFPELRPRDFAPWTEEPDELAARWKKGLERWGLGEPQLSELRDLVSSGLHIYTPGSTAGEPVNVLATLAAPTLDGEALGVLVSDTASALLGLVGKEPDPIRDPAHVVLSHILEAAWEAGESLDLESLVLRLVDPPFSKVGVFPTDRFFPPDDRMKLAMTLNSVLASPSFASWQIGEPLDADRMCRGGVHIFNLAHLSEAERQFFIALLLARLQAWSRKQPGTDDLRALLFFDECTSYLPPDPRRPASKAPLLGLMKQARAVGLGVVLATQNPVDLDYRALSNSGLWFIGRLRTQQDRKRLLKGLDPELDGVVQRLEKRQFALVKASGGHRLFGSRHAMCLLRGPMTRADLEALTPNAPTVPEPGERPSVPSLPSEAPPVRTPQWVLDPRVAFSARLQDHFSRHAEAQNAATVLAPALLAQVNLHFHKDSAGFSERVHEWRVYYPLGDAPGECTALQLETEDLVDTLEGAVYRPLPDWMDEDSELRALKKDIADQVYRSESRGQFVNPVLKLHGRADEPREAFDERVSEAISERVDAKVAKLQERYEKAVERLETRIRGKERRLPGLTGQLERRKAEEIVNAGEIVLALFTRRRKSLNTAMTKRGRVADAKDRIERIDAEIEELRAEALDLRDKLEGDIADIEEKEERVHDATEAREVRLRRADVVVVRFGVLWVPASHRI